jgi:hypothetical protein
MIKRMSRLAALPTVFMIRVIPSKNEFIPANPFAEGLFN